VKSEEEFILAFYSGNDAAFDALFSSYFPRLCAFFSSNGLSFDAEDLALETLFRVAQTRETGSRFSPDKNVPLRAWIYRIASNLTVNHWKSLSRRLKGRPGTKPPAPPAHQGHPLEEGTGPAVECLRRLPAKYRTVVALQLLEDLKIHEIARIVDRPAGTVGRLLKEGRDLLGRLLKERGFRLVHSGEAIPPNAVIVGASGDAKLIRESPSTAIAG
jgi:RNA polymerase sigma factor (sigma-70 family)